MLKHQPAPNHHQRKALTMAEKKCTKCGETKPATAEYFHPQKECKGGLRPDCRQCHNKNSRKYWGANSEQLKAWHRKYRSENREAFRARDKAYYEANKPRLLAQMTKYNRKNREAYNAKLRRWRRNNPDKVQVWVRNRRAKIKQSAGTHSLEDINRLLVAQGFRCVYCPADLSDRANREVDHIVPISRGGSNDVSNIQMLCKSCNRTKRAQLPEEFLAKEEEKQNGRHRINASPVERNSRQ